MPPAENSISQANLAPENSTQRVTPKDVEQEGAEKAAAMVKLLDDMEASIDTQGQYFIKIGQKKPITEMRQVTTSKFLGMGRQTTDQEQTVGYEDNRAFILNAEVRKTDQWTERRNFFVVTPDDIYTVHFYPSEVLNSDPSRNDNKKKQIYDTLTALAKGNQVADDSWKLVRPGPKAASWARPRIESPQVFIHLEDPDANTLKEDFQQAVRDSIQMTESPYKKQVEKVKQQIDVATDTANMIRSLPPRE